MQVHFGEGEDKSKGEIKKVDSLPHHTLLNPGFVLKVLIIYGKL